MGVNMQESIKILNQIIKEIGEDWKKGLDTYLKYESDEMDAEMMPQYNSLFEKFVNTYKEDIIDDKASVMKQVEKIINNDLLFSDLNEYIDKILEAYNAINPLRVLEIQDIQKAKKLVDIIFDQVILRLNPNVQDRYAEFGLGNQEEFFNVGGVLNSICTVIVSQNLHKDAMSGMIRFNTRLSREISEYISDKIDQNFESLKMQLILKKLYPNA